MNNAWEGFVPGKWSQDFVIDVRDFIQRNYVH